MWEMAEWEDYIRNCYAAATRSLSTQSYSSQPIFVTEKKNSQLPSFLDIV